MRFFRLGDCAVFVRYFIILIGISAYFRKRAALSLEYYFLAGRKMPWWGLGLSQMTFWFETDEDQRQNQIHDQTEMPASAMRRLIGASRYGKNRGMI